MLDSRSWRNLGLYLGLGALGLLALHSAIASLYNSLLDGFLVMGVVAGGIGGVVFWQKLEAKAQQQEEVISRDSLKRNLHTVHQMIAKISDESQRQQLFHEAEQIAANLNQNQFRIAVFGTGAAGKTSVVNALLGRVAGQTAPTIGTTQTHQEYDYDPQPAAKTDHNKARINRRIALVDTPGTLEMGTGGQEREITAQKFAQSADLLIFVTAGDLMATEYRELVRLSELGKRIILAFNKTDRYLPSEQQAVMAKLAERTAKFLSPLDIVAIAAQPTPIKVRQYNQPSDVKQTAKTRLVQEWLESVPPDINPLRQRIEHILSLEWEKLLLGNSHLQIKSLQQSARTVLYELKRTEAQKILTKFQCATAATVFANPLPGLDLVANAAINTQLLIELGKLYDQKLTPKQARKTAMLIAQNLAGLGCVEVATTAIAACLKTNVVTYAVGASVQAISAAYLTHLGGMSFVNYLEQEPQLVVNSPNMANALREFCRQNFSSTQGESFLTNFVNDFANGAIAQLVASK